MATVRCDCGRKIRTRTFPLYCSCGRVWVSPDTQGTPQQAQSPPASLPGSILQAMLKEIDAKAYAGCGCESMVAAMNNWGVEGCREHREEIVAKLRESADKLNLWQLLTMGGKALTASWAGSISPLDPLGSLVDEAVRRASDHAK